MYFGVEEMPEADRDSFKLLGRFYSKDKDHVFCGDKIIDMADPETFVLHEENLYAGYRPDAHDVQHEYRDGKIFKPR
jgi:hypothetical protein